MHEAAEELFQEIRHWSARHELSSLQIVVILARMIGNYEAGAFDMAAEDHQNAITALPKPDSE